MGAIVNTAGQAVVQVGQEAVVADGFQRPGSSNARPGDSSDIVGDPIGREALLSELRSEMIPYTPEELIAIGEGDGLV